MLTILLLVTILAIIATIAAGAGVTLYAIYKASLYRSRLMIGKDPRTGDWINLPTTKGN